MKNPFKDHRLMAEMIETPPDITAHSAVNKAESSAHQEKSRPLKALSSAC
ncbi:MAG: hypothetical protein ACTS7E_02115 [Arsenophonus sp. NC-CH8-MAG3]